MIPATVIPLKVLVVLEIRQDRSFPPVQHIPSFRSSLSKQYGGAFFNIFFIKKVNNTFPCIVFQGFMKPIVGLYAEPNVTFLGNNIFQYITFKIHDYHSQYIINIYNTKLAFVMKTILQIHLLYRHTSMVIYIFIKILITETHHSINR